MSKTKIIWTYQYLQGCKEVLPGAAIDETPDKFDRWAIRGHIRVKTKAMPAYKKLATKVNVPIVWIGYMRDQDNKIKANALTGDRFRCEFPCIFDANLGFGCQHFYGKTPREVMDQVEQAFAFTLNCFKNIK